MHKLVIDKKGKVKIRKPVTIHVFTDIIIITKILKVVAEPDSLTERTDLLQFSFKNYKPKGHLELKEVIKKTQVSNLSQSQRKDYYFENFVATRNNELVLLP